MQNVILAAIFYALFQILAAQAASRMSDMWFAIIGVLGVAICTAAIAGMHIATGNELGRLTTPGIILVILANGAIAIYTIFLGRSFQQMPVGTVIPYIFGGAILLSTIVNFALTRTMPTTMQLVSIALISGGLLLLGSQSK